MNTLDAVRPRLAEALAVPPPRGHAQAAFDVLTELCRDGSVQPLVDALIADASAHPADTRARARLSYRHALGFDKFMLLACPPHYMLRAHVWRPSAVPPASAEHIHNHRFSFGSAVLRGELRMRIYTPDHSGDPVTAYREEVGPQDQDWRIRECGSSRLALASELLLKPGSAYCLDSDVRHQIIRASDTCGVTLFLETATVRTGTDVYARPDAVSTASVPKQPLPPDDYVSGLKELSRLLSDTP